MNHSTFRFGFLVFALGLVVGTGLAQDLTLGPVTYSSGSNTFTATNQIETSGATVVTGSANITFQGGTRVRLNPGFQVVAGGTFRAWVSNASIVVDTDADGIPDDWEVAVGRNPGVADSGATTPNGGASGLTYLLEYRLGTDPTKVKEINGSSAPALSVHRPAKP